MTKKKPVTFRVEYDSGFASSSVEVQSTGIRELDEDLARILYLSDYPSVRTAVLQRMEDLGFYDAVGDDHANYDAFLHWQSENEHPGKTNDPKLNPSEDWYFGIIFHHMMTMRRHRKAFEQSLTEGAPDLELIDALETVAIETGAIAREYLIGTREGKAEAARQWQRLREGSSASTRSYQAIRAREAQKWRLPERELAASAWMANPKLSISRVAELVETKLAESGYLTEKGYPPARRTIRQEIADLAPKVGAD